MEFIGSIPFFGGFLSVMIAFVALLSVIIFIHEYGHYIVGRWCGIHAEVFSMGFGPVLTFCLDKRGTKWQLAAFPFGGYVKFLGDKDASSHADPEALAKMDVETRSRSFHGAKLHKKALTVAAGPMANFILSTLIFTGIVLVSGQPSDDLEVGQLKQLPNSSYAIEEGDIITAINGIQTSDYTAFSEYASSADPNLPQMYTLTRGEREIVVEGPFPLLPLIQSMTPRSPAINVGLKVGDFITSVDGQKITAFWELQKLVKASGGIPMNIVVLREGETREFELAANVVDYPKAGGGFEKRTLIGVEGSLFFDRATNRVNPFRAAYVGARGTWRVITSSLDGLYYMIAGRIDKCNLQGPVGIAKTAGDMASLGVGSFIQLIAVLSTAIGLLNLFPVPVLDGGHLVFFGYEAIRGHPPGDKAMRILMSAGLFLVISLMVFAFLNDFIC